MTSQKFSNVRFPAVARSVQKCPAGRRMEGDDKRNDMESEPIRLNIGAGRTVLPGFIPIDRKFGNEADTLGYADNTVAEIYASHVLEHFGHQGGHDALTEWMRVLRPGGRIRLAVPDFAYIAKHYHERGANGLNKSAPNDMTPAQLLRAYAMGGQTDENDFHNSAYDEHSLTQLMQAVGITEIKHWKSSIGDCAALPVSLNLQGVKSVGTAAAKEEVTLPKIVGVMSTSKLGFTENLFCATQALIPRGINLIKNTGAFWGQCMERCMVDAIADEAEWILTLDYDTCFTPTQLERLCYDFAKHPEADAMAPWQAKRETDDPLAWFLNDDGTPRTEILLTEFDTDVSKANHAHFGLTLFRVEALKKMDHPWFWAQPAPDGMWGDGRFDDDIYFWDKWEKSGNTLYIANHVTIGHLQQMVTWVGNDCRPVHQYITDFQEHGPPEGARR